MMIPISGIRISIMSHEYSVSVGFGLKYLASA